MLPSNRAGPHHFTAQTPCPATTHTPTEPARPSAHCRYDARSDARCRCSSCSRWQWLVCAACCCRRLLLSACCLRPLSHVAASEEPAAEALAGQRAGDATGQLQHASIKPPWWAGVYGAVSGPDKPEALARQRGRDATGNLARDHVARTLLHWLVLNKWKACEVVAAGWWIRPCCRNLLHAILAGVGSGPAGVAPPC